jgi:dTDP-4-amino-4,6-dideoxygalactose transaminase
MIPMFKVYTDPKIKDAVGEVLDSGMLGEGPKVKEFTARLQELFNTPKVVPLNSCTSALALAVRLAMNGKKNKVISTPFTMVATSCAIAQEAGGIIWADVSPDTLAMDFTSALHLTTDEVGAVVVTLVGGHVPPGLFEFWQALKSQGIALILDAAHAVNTQYMGMHVARWCDFACFSFQSIKHLTTGDGGALVCHTQAEYKRAEKMKWFGMSRIVPEGMTRLEHQMIADIPEFGYKYHMNDIAACLGLANFDQALINIEIGRKNSEYLIDQLKDVPEITIPILEEDSESSWWLFGLLVQERDQLLKHLADKSVCSSPMWRRNDTYSAFNSLPAGQTLPGMDKVSKEALFIPNGWWLTNNELNLIVESIKEFYK